MARPRKLLGATTKNYTKAEIAEREKDESALHEFKKISKRPPSWLSEDAKAEYKRIIQLVNQLPIADLDLASLTMYCDYYSKYKAASIAVEEEGRTITELDAQGNDRRKVNPEFTAMNDAARNLRSVAGGLGLTIDSRMRIVLPKEDKRMDPFAELLSGD